MSRWGRRPHLSFPDVGSIEGPLLEVMDLHTSFRTGRGLVRAVDGVSLTLGRGEPSVWWASRARARRC